MKNRALPLFACVFALLAAVWTCGSAPSAEASRAVNGTGLGARSTGSSSGSSSGSSGSSSGGACDGGVLSGCAGYADEWPPEQIAGPDGGLLTAWHDIGPGGLDLTPVSGQSANVVANALGSFTGAQGVSSRPTDLITSSNLPLASFAAVTLYAVIEQQTSTFGFNFATSTSTTGIRLLDNAGTIANLASPGASNSDFTAPATSYQLQVARFVATTTGTTAISRVSFGVGHDTMGWGPGGLGTGAFTDAPLNVLSGPGAADPSGDTIVHAVLYKSYHNGATIQAVADLLCAKYAASSLCKPTPTKALGVEADSISSAFASHPPWTALFEADSSATHWQLANAAYGGKTLASASSANALDQIRAGTAFNFVFFIGTNDFANGTATSASTLFTSYLQPYIAAVKTAGAVHVGVVQMLPRTGSLSIPAATFESLRTTWNGLIASNASSLGYDVIPVASDTNIGQAGDDSNLTYFVSDNTHLNAFGESYFYTTLMRPQLSTWGFNISAHSPANDNGLAIAATLIAAALLRRRAANDNDEAAFDRAA
jgi:hypothetical protein